MPEPISLNKIYVAQLQEHLDHAREHARRAYERVERLEGLLADALDARAVPTIYGPARQDPYGTLPLDLRDEIGNRSE